MKKLWVFQTNKKTFLDDCRNYQVYGVADPARLNLLDVSEGDWALLRLKLEGRNEYRYLGPFYVTSEDREWVNTIIQKSGSWKKIKAEQFRSPRWISFYPWCIFLRKSEYYTDELRVLRTSLSISACKPILGDNVDLVISSLIGVQSDKYSDCRKYRTNRGVFVRSRAEYMIDNWFAEHGIVAYYEKKIFIGLGHLIPDWYIPSINTYVEFLGLRGDLIYEERWRKKEMIYKNNGIRYIVLVDEDLENLDVSIPQKIPELKIK